MNQWSSSLQPAPSLLALAPQEHGAPQLRVDALGGVHYEGDSEDSGDDEGNVITEKQAVAEDQDAPKLAVRFHPATYLRPKHIAEESRTRYCPPHAAHAVCCAFFEEQLVVVFGGADGAVPSNATWIYSLREKRWECLNTPGEHTENEALRAVRRLRGHSIVGDIFPPSRCGHCAATIGDVKPLHQDSEQLKSSASLALTTSSVDPATLKASHTFEYDPTMIVFGGANLLQGVYYNDLWAFDVEARAWKELHPAGTPPCPRWHCTAVSLEQRVFIFGGESTTYSLLNDVHVYDHESFLWRAVRVVVPVPPPRMMHAAARIGGDKMLVVGGIGTTTLSDAWLLEMRTLLWRRVGDHSRLSPHAPPAENVSPDRTATPQKSAIEGHVLIPFDNIVILHGGRIGRQFSSIIWAFNIVSEQWSRVGEVSLQENRECPQARWQHCACVLRETSVTRGTRMATTLEELHRQRVHLTDEGEAKAYFAAATVELASQLTFEGSLGVEGSTPVMSRTVCGFIYGGSGYPRNFSDMWRVELVDPTLSTMYQHVKGTSPTRSLAQETSTDDSVKISERLLFPEENSQLYTMSQGSPASRAAVQSQSHSSILRQAAKGRRAK